MAAPNMAMLAQLDRLTQAIGEADFGDRLIGSVGAASSADHVMAFAFLPNQPPRVVISAGSLDERVAARAAAAYAASLYLLDPNYGEVRSIGAGETRWFEETAARSCDHVRETFFEALGIGDVIALANRQKDVIFYMLALRADGQRFAANQAWMLTQLGELIVAAVHKHFSFVHAIKGKNQFVIDRVLNMASAFVGLTPRERVVCLGILTGYTSESIGFNLGISINSVLTYRKRLYDKLGISSQNELFMKVIAALIDMGDDGQDPGRSRVSPAHPLDPATAANAARFDEFFMAEAFILDDVA